PAKSPAAPAPVISKNWRRFIIFLSLILFSVFLPNINYCNHDLGICNCFYYISEIRIAEYIPLWLTESRDLDIGPWE
ncbi:MAG: hypothetical protein PVH42_20590, partial [Desulfobacterales bacterium]